MAVDFKPILRTATALQAVALAKHNAKLAQKKKVTSKDLVKTGVTNVVGTSLIRRHAALVESM